MDRTARETRVRETFRKAGGVLRTGQALRAGIHPRDLYALREAGALEALSRGVHRLADLPPLVHPRRDSEGGENMPGCPGRTALSGSAAVTRPAATGLAHWVQARLKNAAKETGRPFSELLELYAVERFLHRLGRSLQRERFVLKGALLLRHWLGVNARPSRDVDLLGPAELDAAALHEALVDILEAGV